VAIKKGKDPPVDQVIGLRNQGYSNSKIIENLKNQNYSLQEISDAINQSEIKTNIDQQDYDLSDAPSPSSEANLDFPNPEPETQNYSPEPKSFEREMPKYQSFMAEPQRDSYTEKIEEIAESIINEKWEDLLKDIGDIALWKEKIRTDILAIKQEILRTQERFENLQRAVLGKVSEYDGDVREIGTELKAMEKVFEKIIEPLTSNIKELNRITQDLKSKKKK